MNAKGSTGHALRAGPVSEYEDIAACKQDQPARCCSSSAMRRCQYLVFCQALRRAFPRLFPSNRSVSASAERQDNARASQVTLLPLTAHSLHACACSWLLLPLTAVPHDCKLLSVCQAASSAMLNSEVKHPGSLA